MLIGHLYFLCDILVYLLSFYEIIFVSIKFLTSRLFQFRVNYNLPIIFVSIKFLTSRLFQFRLNYNLHIYIYIYLIYDRNSNINSHTHIF